MFIKITAPLYLSGFPRSGVKRIFNVKPKSVKLIASGAECTAATFGDKTRIGQNARFTERAAQFSLQGKFFFKRKRE